MLMACVLCVLPGPDHDISIAPIRYDFYRVRRSQVGICPCIGVDQAGILRGTHAMASAEGGSVPNGVGYGSVSYTHLTLPTNREV